MNEDSGIKLNEISCFFPPPSQFTQKSYFYVSSIAGWLLAMDGNPIQRVRKPTKRKLVISFMLSSRFSKILRMIKNYN